MPSNQELQDGTGYVFYELVTLFHARVIHMRAAEKQACGSSSEFNAMWNAVQCVAIESFLVHYRTLYEFFHNREKGKDNDSLLANQYATGWSGKGEWDKDAPPDEQKRINKLLSHISFRRQGLLPGN